MEETQKKNIERLELELKEEIILGKEKMELIKDEYRLLSSHYFHEDSFYQKSITIFLTLNTGLLAFINAIAESNEYSIYIPIIGIVSVISWSVSIYRSKFFKNKLENRIVEIETLIQEKFSNKPSIMHLRTNRGTFPLLARIPSTVTNMILPIAFAVIWIIILMKN